MRLTLMPRAFEQAANRGCGETLAERRHGLRQFTKMYFADMSATSLDVFEICAGWARFKYRRVGARKQWVDFFAESSAYREGAVDFRV